MKFLFSIFILLLLGSFASAQEVGNVYSLIGYKYIIIHDPDYSSSQQDDQEIIRIVRNLFLNKGFKAYTEDVDFKKLPSEFKTDTCIILDCYLEYSLKVSLKQYGRITLKNCHEEIVFENTGEAVFGSVEEAMENAFEPIAKMKYKYDPKRKIPSQWY
jgi:hypothetical protein